MGHAIRDMEDVYSRQGTARIGSKDNVCEGVQGIGGSRDREGLEG